MNPLTHKPTVVAFDADDTLFVNEPYFRETEEAFAALLEDYLPRHTSAKELFATEIKNLTLYGYGIKGFTLSMVETALQISNHTINSKTISKILDLGKELLAKPIELLPAVEETLQALQGHYTLIVATKGDLLDQQRKLAKSGLEKYFHHIEVMSEKQVSDYHKILRRLQVEPAQFMMIGNSLKSDVLPLLEMGAYGVHIPFHITWEHEKVEHQIEHEKFYQLKDISEVKNLLL
ncbi:MAG: HAD family hydrolase [Bacteroidetes bacterium]|nr:MAG: HAD family hydrolase [Bacteroidota bacterium]TAF92055.1 MAG: HAD family hydrolase [Bacteroidota bacterium]